MALVCIIFFCILLSIPVNILLLNIIQNINIDYPVFFNISVLLSYIGISIRSISVFTLFAAVYWLFKKVLWKKKPFKYILNVPNLNGEWHGEVISTHMSDDSEIVKIFNVKLLIQQDWEKIVIRMTFPSSTSYSENINLYEKL